MKLWLCLSFALFAALSSCQRRGVPGDSGYDSLQLKHARDSIELVSHLPNELLGTLKIQKGDLDSMFRRRYIRAAVSYSITYYYVDGKVRKGIALDLLTEFEKELNALMKFPPGHVGIIFIPVNREMVIPMVRDGYADIGVAGLAITPERTTEIDFGAPVVMGLNEIIIGSPRSPRLKTLADLSGKQVYTHHSSGYESSLIRVSDSLVTHGLPPIEIVTVDPFLEIEDLLAMTDANLIPYTVSLDYYADQWKNVLDSMRVYRDLTIRRSVSLAWVMRKGTPKLKKQVDKFMLANRKGTRIGNIVYNRYLNSSRLTKIKASRTSDEFKSVSNIFKKYGDEYRLDWMLLASQGYQESALNQNVVSGAGAVGIMQIKPTTAAGAPINIRNVHLLDNNIHAGTKYMRFLIDEYLKDEAIDSLNKHLLALASYNAGPNRIAALREEARQKGYDPNVWFDQVENIVAHRVGNETVQYVSNIYKYYISYKGIERYGKVKEKMAIVPSK